MESVGVLDDLEETRSATRHGISSFEFELLWLGLLG